MSANTSSVGVTPTLASIINKHASAISTARSVKRRIRPCRLSRVMPASGPVRRRSSPNIVLIRVDFPAFGRPMTATCIGFCTVGKLYSSKVSPSTKSKSTIGAFSMDSSSAELIRGASKIASSPIPSPCSADILKGSPSPKA